MKIISVRAPWWWFIFYAGKDVENRGEHFGPDYNGPLAIHASAWWSEREVLSDINAARAMSGAESFDVSGNQLRDNCGKIVGVVHSLGRIKNCMPVLHPLASKINSSWYVGPTALVLAKPRALAEAIPFKSRLGLFDAPADIARRLAS